MRKSLKKHPRLHKYWTRRKRILLGLPDGRVDPMINGGRDRMRELVRMRDNHTCQKCRKVWKKGERRFDVHHISKRMDGKGRKHGVIRYDKKHMDKLVTLCHKCHLNLDVTIEKMRKAAKIYRKRLSTVLVLPEIDNGVQYTHDTKVTTYLKKV